ncbi:cuticle protein 16.8 [Papilio machaon]|uniref:cuticle protein 16.8 n=1 Tax=Papilio machaon TaxID=76193 RepID=UPI001E6647C9|nr:cuticle protein 16.8 [Papilio machaon]
MAYDKLLILLAAISLVSADVSHILEDPSTEPPPPLPYSFSYTAGRYPGHADRQHSEVSDGSGVVKGSFSYVDPRQKIRTVDYVADREGFHPVLSDVPPEHPSDSESVAQAKDRHFQLYARIAEEHAHPENIVPSVPRQTEAVAAAAAKHAQLFRVIAEQHARIAAEREALQREEEERQHLQELQEIGN